MAAKRTKASAEDDEVESLTVSSFRESIKAKNATFHIQLVGPRANGKIAPAFLDASSDLMNDIRDKASSYVSVSDVSKAEWRIVPAARNEPAGESYFIELVGHRLPSKKSKSESYVPSYLYVEEVLTFDYRDVVSTRMCVHDSKRSSFAVLPTGDGTFRLKNLDFEIATIDHLGNINPYGMTSKAIKKGKHGSYVNVAEVASGDFRSEHSTRIHSGMSQLSNWMFYPVA